MIFHQAADGGALDLARRLIATLPQGRDGLFNPWADVCPEDLADNGPGTKLARLAAHLNCRPRLILCGEAPGYQGCRHTGVAFTSERLILEGAIPRISPTCTRLTSRHIPYSEPSATIVWRTLYQLGLAEDTILWNAIQMHPHKPGNPSSNRTPTEAEIALGAPAIHMLREAMPSAQIVAVGRTPDFLLRNMGIVPAVTVRHPANGGANAFSSGLADFIGN